MKSNWIMGALAALSSVVVASPAAASTCSQLNDLYISKFHDDFKVSWAAAPFTCPSNQSAIVEAMNNLYTTTFRIAVSTAIPNFYNWVTGLLTSLQYSDQDAASPWAVASTARDGVMTLHQSFGTQDPVWRTSVLVHESRHTQSDDPGHVSCDHGPDQGMIACDAALVADSTWAGSGYNYQLLYLWWVRDESTFTPLDRALVVTTLKSLVLNNFNSVSNAQVLKWAP